MGLFDFRKKNRQKEKEEEIVIELEVEEGATQADIKSLAEEALGRPVEAMTVVSDVAGEEGSAGDAGTEGDAATAADAGGADAAARHADVAGDADLAARWEKAHKASPQAYEREDGTMILVFTMAEETDTILPLEPRQMYKMDGIVIRDVRLGLVNADSQELIGDLPYEVCGRFLGQHTLEARPPFALVGAMSLAEMEALITAAENALKEREGLREMLAENMDFLSADQISADLAAAAFSGQYVDRDLLTDIPFPSGEVIVTDPALSLPDPDKISYLRQEIPAGKHPLTIGLLHTTVNGQALDRVTGIRLQIGDGTAVRYELAEDYTMIDDEKEGPGFMGYSVGSGYAAFCDSAVAESFWDYLDDWDEAHPDEDFYADVLQDRLANADRPYLRFAIPDTDQEIVMVSAGLGDGFYSAYWGYDADGKLVDLVSVFIDPALYERLVTGVAADDAAAFDDSEEIELEL